jgi:hypothetical protein
LVVDGEDAWLLRGHFETVPGFAIKSIAYFHIFPLELHIAESEFLVDKVATHKIIEDWLYNEVTHDDKPGPSEETIQILLRELFAGILASSNESDG